jgi:arsenical pump membrane protein
MQQVAVFFGPVLTIALVLTRPGVGQKLRVTPAIAAGVGVAVMFALRFLEPAEIWRAADVLWRPFVGVGSIMVTAAVAERVGLLERAASYAERSTKGPVWVAFAVVFGISATVATLFNNDAAILVLTPVMVKLIKRRYPGRPNLTLPFAFAVFSAAGVAALVISNPINLVVASHAGIGFNAYAKVMLPVAAAGQLVAFLALGAVFRRDIADRQPGTGELSPPPGKMRVAERQALLVMVMGLGLYPVVSFFDGPVWVVALLGAAAGVAVCKREDGAAPLGFVWDAVAWDVLLFLYGVFIMAQGLRASGVVGHLTDLYSAFEPAGARVATIGTVSAVGSALLNNHPMAILNALAIADVPYVDDRQVLAALIGGDLGPRLLPIGSLAGLLWLRTLRRYGIEVPLRQFVQVGAAITLPALIVSLLVLMRIG